MLAAPAPTPAFIASSAPAASSGNSAAKRLRSGARKMKRKREKGKKAKRIKNQSIGGIGGTPVLCRMAMASRTAGNARPTLLYFMIISINIRRTTNR